MTWCGPWTAPLAQAMKNGLQSELERLVPVQVVDCVKVGEVFKLTVVIVVPARRAGMFDVSRVPHQARLVLRSLAAQKPIEVLEAIAAGPIIGTARRRSSARRASCATGCQMPTWRSRNPSAPRPPVHGACFCRDNAGVAVPVIGQLGDLAAADAVLVSPAQEPRARWVNTSPWCGTGCRRRLA